MIRAWNSNFKLSTSFYQISDRSSKYLIDFIKTSEICQNYTFILKLQNLILNDELRHILSDDIKTIKSNLYNGNGFIIIKPIKSLNIYEQAIIPWIIGQCLGETVGQNYNDDKLYIVNDIGGKMEDGYRYSRTNQGGSIHTDGVNVKIPIDSFLLHSITEGMEGGESIIVNGISVYKYLENKHPDVMKILKENFKWEYKGVQKNKFYSEPILKIVNGNPEWRYLRNYIEEAAIKSSQGLSIKKIWAMDCLDSILESSFFQVRYKLKKGETLIINDRCVFHGRTSFVDYMNSNHFKDINKQREMNKVLKRTGLRIWVKNSL
jgi:hypothetical protein